MTTENQAPEGADERAAFEAWAPTVHMRTERWAVNPELYDDEDAISAWSGWSARAALAAHRAAPAPSPAEGDTESGVVFAEAAKLFKQIDALLKPHGWPAQKMLRDYVEVVKRAIAAANPQPTGTSAPALPAVEEARGFVAFGAGVYRVCQTVEPGLVVTFRRPGEEDRAVGERNAAPDLTPIPPEEIIVRLEFRSVAGLDSLEDHLREIRQQHWPETVPNLLVDAMAHASALGWAVTKEWARGWNDARLAIAQAHLVPAPAPAQASEERNCSTCLHSSKSADDYPCRRCGFEGGNGPFCKWEQAAHQLYTTDDAGAPDAIRDRNGDVVLGLCKVCGKGEAELSTSCAVPCAAVGAGDGRQDIGGHIRAAANTKVAQQANDDTRRLDYLQKKQATISLVPDGRDENGTRHAFMVGGWHCSVNRDVRAAIDAAMGASQPPVQGSES